VPGGEIVVGGLGHPDTLNPLLAESEVGRALVPLLFDSLLAYDAHSGLLIPHLAEAWTVASDSRTITFTLRTDARWHDGRSVAADDVVFSIQAARDPVLNSLYSPQLGHVIQVAAPGNDRVVVSLDEAHCPSVAILGELPLIPQHLLTEADLDSNSFDSTLVGSGPFVFVEWTPGGEVHLARNDDYWGDVPYLDVWRYRPFETAPELVRAMKSEQLDAALVPPGQLADMADPPLPFSVYRYPMPEFLFIAFNNDHPVLGDSRVRMALSMAVDRQQLLEQVLGGGGELMAASLPAGHWAADPALQAPPYDPKGAQQLLLEAGWADSDGDGWLDRDGERLRLPVRTNGGNRLREDVATLLTSYYRAIGVDASLELVNWGAVVDDLFTHDFDTMVLSWPIWAEPGQSQWWLSTQDEIGSGYNVVSFANQRVDQLLQEALTVPGCDADRRAELYQEVQSVLARERPYDFLFLPYSTLLTQPDLHRPISGPFAGPLESAASWYLVP
jgi:peptide/nickel transport system substrate-binding protein